MVELRKIDWHENNLEDGTKYLMAFVRPDGNEDNSTRIGEVRVHSDGSVRAHSEILKSYSTYRTSVGRGSVEEAKAFICKTFRDYMKLLINGEVVLHKDDSPESDDYVPTNWFSGDPEFDKEFTKKARKFKEDMKSKDVEALKATARQWREDTKYEKFPKYPYGHKLCRVAMECAEEWWIECSYDIDDRQEVISDSYYHS